MQQRAQDPNRGTVLRRSVLVCTAAALTAAALFSGPSAARQVRLVSTTRKAPSAGVAPTARAANAVPPIAPSRGKPFYPATGDWEGTVNGFPASFELLFEPNYELDGLPPYGYQDMVVLEPRSCPPAPYSHAENFISPGPASRVQTGGSFGLSRLGFAGGMTGSRTASLSASFHISSGAGCKARFTWNLHPARRRAVQDGTWKLHFAHGGSSTFRVRAGGRLATSVRLASQLAACGGPLGALDLFIGSGATATFDHPHVLSVVLHFSRRSANGKMTVLGGRCAKPSVTLRASLQKPSG